MTNLRTPSENMDDYAYLRTAERELSRLADLTGEDSGASDIGRILAHGLAAIANALLSLDEGTRAGAIDVSNAVCDVATCLPAVPETVVLELRREVRRTIAGSGE